MKRMAQDNPTLLATAPAVRGVLPFPIQPDTTFEAVLGHVYQAQHDELWRYAAHFVGEDEAEDIVGAAFCEVCARFRDKPNLRPLEEIPGLVFGAVRFRAIDYRNTVQRRETILPRYVQDAIARFGMWFEPREVREQTLFTRTVAAAVAEMTPAVRETYVLHHEADLDARRIAALTGRTYDAVRALITRGNTILRDHLDRAGLSPARVRQGGTI